MVTLPEELWTSGLACLSVGEAGLRRHPRGQALGTVTLPEELWTSSLVPQSEHEVAVGLSLEVHRVLRRVDGRKDSLQTSASHIFVVRVHHQLPLWLLEESYSFRGGIA